MNQVTKRPYHSARRSQQAAQTRTDIVAAAIALFGERGWGGTTVSLVADRAGVAPETVYSVFKSKKNLLRAAMDVAVVGDTDEVPFVARDEFRRLGEGPLDDRLVVMAAVVADIHERSIGVWRAILEASSCDDEVDRWRAELEAGRRLDVGRSLDRIFGRRVPTRDADVVWVLFGPESYVKLREDVGLSRRVYERLLIDTVRRLLG